MLYIYIYVHILRPSSILIITIRQQHAAARTAAESSLGVRKHFASVIAKKDLWAFANVFGVVATSSGCSQTRIYIK